MEARKRRRRGSLTDLVPQVARRFLADLQPGVRMPTVRDLARMHRSSSSSVHAAISRLEEAGAIEIETRGRAGAFLVRHSVGRLWAMTSSGPLVVAHPLVTSPRYEALATALRQLLTRAGLEVILVFVRGSRQRLQAVREGRCHLAAMSSFAASELCSAEDVVIWELLPNSYNTGHRVFYRPGADGVTPLRVVVDPHSADQQLLTELEFGGSDVIPIQVMPSQIVRLFNNSGADAAVWTTDEMQSRWSDAVLERPLSAEVRDRIGDRDTRAVLVGRRSEANALRAICELLDPKQIEEVQNDVLAGRTVPEY